MPKRWIFSAQITRFAGLFTLLMMVFVELAGAQATNGTIPVTEREAATWLTEQNNTVNRNSGGHVVEVIIDYVPEVFVVGDLDVFEHLETMHINVTGDFFDHHMSGIARLTGLKSVKFVECTSITSSTLAVLHHLPNLNSLELVECESLKSLSALSNCRTLKEIKFLDSNEFNYAELAYLKNLPALEQIVLDGSIVSDDDLELLADVTTLKRLHVNECANITDEGISAIAQKGTLVELSAYGNPQLTGKCLNELVKCPVEVLNLSYSALVPGALKSISQLQKVRDLALSGIDTMSLAKPDLFASLHELEKLYVQATRIENECLINIASQKLQTLDLSNCSKIRLEGLGQLKSAQVLQELFLEGIRRPDTKSMEALVSGFPNLKLLELSQSRLRSENIAPIANLKSLETLDLSGCLLLDNGAIEAISKLPNLEVLNLDEIWRLTDEAFVNLAKLPKLRELSLSKNRKITGAGIQYLAGNNTLESLQLMEMKRLTPESFSMLQDLKGLKKLTISSTSLTDAHLTELFGLRLESLSLSNSFGSIESELYNDLVESVTKADQ